MSEPAPIHVNRPDLPDLDELAPILRTLWSSRRLTNGGSFSDQLEVALAEVLNVPRVLLFSSGTQALLTALRGLNLQAGDEVITTPFSFVASTHVLAWSGLTPVFVDIEPDAYTLDPRLVESAVSARTKAILPVHVYGHPCHTTAIAGVAERFGLKVLYDAAHAFGVRSHGGALLAAGDVSALSFHATKVFHTFEGGALVCRDSELATGLRRMRNFGMIGDSTVESVGLNGKLSELHAAIGLLQLPTFEARNVRRSRIDKAYREALNGIPGLSLPPMTDVIQHNYGYFPVRIGADFTCTRDELHESLRYRGVITRRYFYPLISSMALYATMPGAHPERLPVAHRVAREGLCLPIYASMTEGDQDRVIEALLDVARAGPSV